MPNIYFELTEAFNAKEPVVALASGQAVVYYRIAINLRPLREAHDRLLEIAERLLPRAPTPGSPDADAQ